jgi:hypothetical protein
MRIGLGGEMSDEFWTTMGTPQGDLVVYPHCFSSIFSSLLAVLRTEFAVKVWIEADNPACMPMTCIFLEAV